MTIKSTPVPYSPKDATYIDRCLLSGGVDKPSASVLSFSYPNIHSSRITYLFSYLLNSQMLEISVECCYGCNADKTVNFWLLNRIKGREWESKVDHWDHFAAAHNDELCNG